MQQADTIKTTDRKISIFYSALGACSIGGVIIKF